METWINNQGAYYHNFIDGNFVEAQAAYIPLVHVANAEQILGYFPNSSAQEVHEAIVAAERSKEKLCSLSMTERSQMMLRFADFLQRDRQELAYAISAEQGKVLAEAYGEIDRATSEARFVATEALRVQGLYLPGEKLGVHNIVQHVPIGVVAAIAPWNFPVVTPIRKIVPAFIYGCPVVFKPASATPFSASKLMALFVEANVPNGTINMVIGSGSVVGEALIQHPLVRGISFTGSTAQGLHIQQVAAKRLAKTQLELGGKNAAIVLSTNNVQTVAKQIVNAAFGCTGQRCTAISRVIVISGLKEQLTTAIVEEVERINVGAAWEVGVTMGPVINHAHLESIMNDIDSAQREGANLLIGGYRLTGGKYELGNYLAPTVFDSVAATMSIAQREIFGPVLSIQEVDNVAEAIRIANQTEYGLATSIFTSDISEAHIVANAVHSGMVHINHGTSSAHHMPFGGVKKSGFGAFSIGSSNQQFYTEPKVMYIQY